jgi:hypothetical protein
MARRPPPLPMPEPGDDAFWDALEARIADQRWRLAMSIGQWARRERERISVQVREACVAIDPGSQKRLDLDGASGIEKFRYFASIPKRDPLDGKRVVFGPMPMADPNAVYVTTCTTPAGHRW